MRGELKNVIGLYFSFFKSDFYIIYLMNKSREISTFLFSTTSNQWSALCSLPRYLEKNYIPQKVQHFFDNFSVCQKISTQHCIRKKSSKNHLALACNFCIMGFKILYFFRKGIVKLFWKTTMYLFLAFQCYFTWRIEFELKN